MADGPTSSELGLINGEAIEKYFQQPSSSFSQVVLTEWADANDHLKFHLQETPPQPNEAHDSFITIDGNDITFQRSPTLSDILQAAQQLRETEKKQRGQESGMRFENSTLERLGLLLIDSAIYLSHQKKGKEHKQQIETMFNLGANLEVRAKRVNASPLVLKFEDISLLETTPFKHPLKEEDEQERKQRQQTYENSLILFMLGKHTITKDKQGNVLPYVSYYDKSYHQWLQDNQHQDIAENQQLFEKELLQNKDNLQDLIFNQLNEELQTGNRVDQLAEQRILQRLDEAIQDKGKTLLEKEMPPPPLVNDIGPDLLKELEVIYGPNFTDQFKQDQLKLFKVAGEVISRLKDKPTYDKLVALWDLVQAYDFQVTIIPTEAITEKAMECNLRSYLLSSLFEHYLKDEVIVFHDIPTEHTSLIVIDKNSLTQTSSTPIGYFIDATRFSRWLYTAESKRIPNPLQWGGVYQIQDQQFVNQIVRAWLDNPKMVNLNLKLDDQQYISFFPIEEKHEQTYRNIHSIKESIRVGLWNNLGLSYLYNDDIESARACLLKALEINPKMAESWSNLGLTYTDQEKQRTYYLKSLELNPNNDITIYNICHTLEHEVDPQTILTPQVLQLLENWLEKFINGEVNPDWKTSNKVNIARQVLQKIKTTNSSL